MSDLLEHLDRLFSDGPISFERFMHAALYDPDFGYYTAGIETVGGRQADFATSATLSDNLGKAVGGWIQRQLHEINTRTVIEVGAGDGSLAKSALKSMGLLKRRRVDYRIVEISPVLKRKQQKCLGRKVTWFPTIEEAIRGESNAIILSNELVDAFPIRWFRWNETWKEIFVQFDRNSGLSETFREPAAEEFDFSPFPARENQRVEIHDSYHRWISSWMPKLENAAVLTIDYGGSAHDIYLNRINGTMRGYFRHSRVEGGDIYRRIGAQDLTADVNFDALQDWGAEFGFLTTGYQTQGRFLEKFLSQAPELGEANEAFQVLEQTKRSCLQKRTD